MASDGESQETQAGATNAACADESSPSSPRRGEGGLAAWPAIADMNYLNSVIRVIKLLYMESMGNFYQSRTV